MKLLHRARNTALGHVATVSGFARGIFHPEIAPEGVPFLTTIEDATFGTISIRGHLANESAKTLVIIVHGMGGNITSAYAIRAANAAVAAGCAALRIDLRGASGDGDDIYHAGLGADLGQITRAPALAKFERIAIVGYSLGGHISLRHASDGPHDPRLCAVVAVCPPIDLDRGTMAIQRIDRRPYQEFVLRSLRKQLDEVRARHPSAWPAFDSEAIRTIREWDERVICARFGFESLETYYRDQSIGPRLSKVTIPTLLVIAERDPMIAFDTVEPWLETASEAITIVRKQSGGHVAFPRDVGLTTPLGSGMEREVIQWITAGGVR